MRTSSSRGRDFPIAVVGMSCRFPGEATCPSKFWEMMKNGRDAYSPDTDRYNTEAFYHANSSGRTNVLPTKGGHFIKQDPYAFDTAFFKLSAAEASVADPKMRISFEVAYEALENANISLKDVAGTNTACYMGTAWSDYRDALVRDFEHWHRLYMLGVNDELISNRLSHFFDIHGPSVTVQTACSSSLVAIHQACESLRTGQAEMALAGGVNMILTPDSTMELHNLSVVNPEGRSLSFDQKANGYGRGEGCGVVVLKPLDAAVRDGDPIRAVIRATGVNSDGWTKTITEPSGSAQEDLIKFVYESHGLDYGSTQYIEAHGTGTKVGDPIEVRAIHNTLGQAATQTRKLLVGSVKANIGHLEPAAGVAGVIKGILSLEHGAIPPNVHFNEPNHAIPFDEWNMVVPTELTPWPDAPTKRMSVSSFGIGGTNAHLVLEEYLPGLKLDGTPNGTSNIHRPLQVKNRLFVFSSHDQSGIKRVAESLSGHIDSLDSGAHNESEYLASLAHTLSGARSRLGWKASCIADSLAQLRQKLSTGLEDRITRATSGEPPVVAFVFTGQGAQWAGMGLELLDRPVFSGSVAKSTKFLHDLGCPWDPVTELRRTGSDSRLDIPEISQPICTLLQIALVDELKSWGVSKPDKVVGHSSGEIAAAYCIGALRHCDAVAAAYYRGMAAAMMKTVAPNLDGSMMAAGCSREMAEKLISDLHLNDQVTVACVNSPSSVTLSGDTAGISAMADAMAKQGTFHRKLKVKVAYHSHHVSAIASDYYELIGNIEPVVTPGISTRMISSVTGQEITPELLGSFYWTRNLTSPVLFLDALRTLLMPDGPDSSQSSVDLLIEIGPHSTLGGPIEQTLSHHGIQNVTYKSILQRGTNSSDSALQLAQDLFHLGLPLSMSNVNGDSSTGSGRQLLVDLPPYPWNHERKYEAYSRRQKERMFRETLRKSLLGAPTPKIHEREHTWRSSIRLDDEPWLRGHTVGDTVVFPAAGMVSMALEAVQQIAEPGKKIYALRVRDFSVFAAVSLLEGTTAEAIVTMRPHSGTPSGQTSSGWWEFTVSFSNGTQLRDSSRGLIMIDYEEGRSKHMAHEDASNAAWRIAEYHTAVRELEGQTMSKEELYSHYKKSAFKYGGAFQSIENLHPGDGKAHYHLRLGDIGKTFSEGQRPNTKPFLPVNAATIDCMFQTFIAGTYRDGALWFQKHFAPVGIRELEIRMDVPANPDDIVPGFTTTQSHGSNELTSDIFLFDTALSKLVVSAVDFRVSGLDTVGGAEDDGQDASAKLKLEDAGVSTVTSEVKWHYSMSHLQREEMVRVVDAAGDELQDRVAELLRLILHEKPAAVIAELVEETTALPDTSVNYTLSKPGTLPRGSVPPSNVCYAVVKAAERCDNVVSEKGAAIHGEPFPLTDEVQLEAKRSCADVLVLTSRSLGNSSTPDSWESTLDRFVALAKPKAILVVAGCHHLLAGEPINRTRLLEHLLDISGRSNQSITLYGILPQEEGPLEEASNSILDALPIHWASGLNTPASLDEKEPVEPGHMLSHQKSTRAQVPQAFKSDTSLEQDLLLVKTTSSAPRQDQHAGNMKKVPSGAEASDFIIIEPHNSSTAGEQFCRLLQSTLAQQLQLASSVSCCQWNDVAGATHFFSGKTVISLLEASQPILYDLSEADFESLRSVILESRRFIWVTCGDDPLLHVVDGLARTLNNEMAGFRFQILHLSATGMMDGPTLVSRILTSKSEDNEFCEAEGLLQTSRVYKSFEGDAQMGEHLVDSMRHMSLTVAQEKGPLRLAIGRPGLLDTLHFVRDERLLAPLADTDVEIRVEASGMNFKDVMGAMGLISLPLLGLEASGVIVRTGKVAAQHFTPGDRVAALAHGSHASTIRTHHALAVKIPDAMTFKEAAGISMVYTTVYCAFVNVAKLKKGQSVLIHSAAGGVGQAAVQLARFLGLVIYITVGSDDKRKFMMDRYGIPESHIFYSRDLSFVKGIVRVTKGRGVDCILNSLADELLRGAWDSGCLAKFGTFVELGLRNISNNSQLDMRPFVKNVTFTFMDYSDYPVEELGSVMNQVFELVSQGHLSAPYPLQSYPVHQVEDAFRTMQQGKHCGKIVLSWDVDSWVPVLQRAKDLFQLHPDGTYLLVGGNGGLGRSLARAFVAAGARNIALISRSGDSGEDTKALITELASRGVAVRAYCSDVSDKESFRTAMEQCSKELPPVRGVVQLAMVLRDSVFEKMSYSQWNQPLRPKVQGSRNLHDYFDGSESRALDFLILCSSVSGLCGTPGQAAYAAGNSYEDALALYRRARGLPTAAIDLGVMLDVGVVAEQKAELGSVEQWGKVAGIPEATFHAIVKSVINGLRQQPPDNRTQPPAQLVTGLGAADSWAAEGVPLPFFYGDRRFEPLSITISSHKDGAHKTGGNTSVASQLERAASMAEAAETVTTALVKRMAEILAIPEGEIDLSQPLYRYGIDSLSAIELRNWITRELKANVALLEIVSASAIKDFATTITEKSALVSALN